MIIGPINRIVWCGLFSDVRHWLLDVVGLFVELVESENIAHLAVVPVGTQY
jgi:hypothetical protein